MFSTSPPKDRPAHHANGTKNSFQNPWSEASQATSEQWVAPGMFSLPLEWEQAHPNHPHKPVEVIKPTFKLDSKGLKSTWLGHESFLVELPTTSKDDVPIRILYDPIFSDRAGPSQWASVKRRLPPPCTVEDLPDFHYVIYSHNHYDHLDYPSLVSILEKRGKDVHFVVPLGNKSWFLESGIGAEQISEMDWWEEITLSSNNNQIKFACTPAIHTSGRGVTDKKTSLWASWVVEQSLERAGKEARRITVYHAGDTGYMTANGPCPIFEEIGAKYGPFELSMLPIWRGGSLSFVARMGLKLTEHPLMSALHATPSQAMAIHRAIRSRHTLAMHFATFAGSDVEAFDPIVQLTKSREEFHVGDWSDENGFGIIDVGETAVIPLEDDVEL